jgi:hypothetical protein
MNAKPQSKSSRIPPAVFSGNGKRGYNGSSNANGHPKANGHSGATSAVPNSEPPAQASAPPEEPAAPQPELPPLDAESRRELSQYRAERLRESSNSIFLFGALKDLFGERYTPEAFALYRDKVLADTGNPSDPISQMLVEQLLLANLLTGKLLTKAAATDRLDAFELYQTAAVKLMAEFRRGAVALAALREPQGKKSIRIVSDDAGDMEVLARRRRAKERQAG